MTDEYWDRLIQGHFDDALTDAERLEFAALMRDSEAARRRFWELAEVHGLARDAARFAWHDAEVEKAEVGSEIRRTNVIHRVRRALQQMRPIGLLAVGLVVGILTTGLAWAITRSPSASFQVLLSESFESSAAPVANGVPTSVGIWSGDFTEIVAAQPEVQPANERHMLRFLEADYAGKPNPGGYISEVYRLIDVRSYRAEMISGDAVVQTSALFNAAPFSDQEKYHCSISVFALDLAMATDGGTRTNPALIDQALAVTRRSNDLLDRDPRTWQKLSTDLRLPANTDFLLIRIAMAHGTPNRKSENHNRFAAHFADDVRVILTRRPPLP